MQQNLLPGLSGEGGKAIVCGVILATAVAVIWQYDSGARGVRVFERVLKGMVGVVVVSFVGVVVAMAAAGSLDLGAVAAGFVPDPPCCGRPRRRSSRTSPPSTPRTATSGSTASWPSIFTEVDYSASPLMSSLLAWHLHGLWADYAAVWNTTTSAGTSDTRCGATISLHP